MERMFINKQNVFCSYCMNISIPNAEWKRYRYIGNQNVRSEGLHGHSATLFPICCFYKYDYSRSRGKYADYDLYRRYRYSQDLCSCREKMDDSEYDNVLSLLKIISNNPPNSLVFFPQRVTRNWDNYITFHFKYFVQLLNKTNISYSFDIRELQSNNLLNGNVNTLVIFEVSSNPKSIDNNINEIVNAYNQQPPNLIYISLFTEVGKEGKILYYKKEEIGKMFRR